MDEGKWITLKDGRRIFLKPKKIETSATNDYMNAKLRSMAGVKVENNEEEIVEAVHITKAENAKSIQENGFDLEKAKTGAGNTFGKGVYFSNEPTSTEYWDWRIEHNKKIKADIDTTGFLKVEYEEYTSPNNFMDPVIKKFNNNERKQYNQLLKQYKEENKLSESLYNAGKPKEEWEKYWHIDAKQDAVNKVLESNYAGLIIKQNTPKMDVITGGSQIVVYDTSRIKIKK